MDHSLGDHRSARPHIYKVIYHSFIDDPDDHDAVMRDVRSILEWSRDWNPRHGITGALMLNGNKFSQVLEGPSHAVKALFGHIVCDKRHKHVELLESGLFHDRDFGNWAMAFVPSPREPDIKMATTRKASDETLGPGGWLVLSALRSLVNEAAG